MKLSIITVNYNNIEGLKKTLESVLTQNWKNFEFIVIDGGSSDGSKEIIELNNEKLDFWVSEPDKGIYNAMNKGIKASKGSYLLFLNSGDELRESTVLEAVESELNGGKDVYYGNLVFITDTVEQLEIYPDQLTFSFFYESSLPHPAAFIKRDLFDKVFYYNEDYKIVSDWEFFMVAICKEKASYKHIEKTISNFYADGISNDPKNKEKLNKERENCLTNHFAPFIADMKQLKSANKILKMNRFKMLTELESNKAARNINSLVLRILLKFVKGKKVEDLN